MDSTQNTDIQIPQEIRDFLEGMLTDAHMTYLDETMHDEMIKELYARLDAFLTTAIVEALPEDQLEVFIKMNEERKPREELETYIKSVLPNAQEVFTNAFMDFRDLYLGSVVTARTTPDTTDEPVDAPPPLPPAPKGEKNTGKEPQ